MINEEKTKERIKELIKKTENIVYRAEANLNRAVKECAKLKGFENYILFSADFSSGFETVVKFNDDGEMADLDITVMLELDKNGIIMFLKDFLEDESIELLK